MNNSHWVIWFIETCKTLRNCPFSLTIKTGLWIADVTGVDLGAAMSAVGGELTTSDNNEGLMCYFVDKWRLFGNQNTINLFTNLTMLFQSQVTKVSNSKSSETKITPIFI